MASPLHKTRTPSEQPSRIAPVLQEPPAAREEEPDRGSRVVLAAWLLAFIFLGSLALRDLIMALLFR